MRTNLISIVDMAPFYPQGPFLEMIDRLQKQVDGLGVDSSSQVIAGLFNVGDADELAEFGYRPAMTMRMKESSNPAEVDYWARRITTEAA